MTDIPQYKSTLTGTEIDAAMKKMAENEIGDFVLKSALLDLVYPVGSVYISYNSASPAALFGGSWTQIQGRFLLAADSTHPAGSTGGEATHTLTADEMPSHAHGLPGYTELLNSGDDYHHSSGAGSHQFTSTFNVTNATGGSQPHNNMPPYLAVYMWWRTA